MEQRDRSTEALVEQLRNLNETFMRIADQMERANDILAAQRLTYRDVEVGD